MSAHARNVSPLAAALQSSEPLSRLAERLRESRERLRCIENVLPDPLAQQLRPGPIDADGWTVLASNSAVAAKLRQLVPDLQATLLAAGHKALPIRVKVLPT